MRTPIRPRMVSDESGFTIAEMLCALAMMLVIAAAVLTTLEGFTSNAARQTRITDANDHVRKTMDRIVSDLRQAATIEVAGPNDLVYTVTESATSTRRERVCVSSSGRLWRTSVSYATAPTTPIAAGTTCPTAGSATGQIANLESANTSANPVFTYDSATPASVRSVGLTVALKAGDVRRPYTSTLRASTFVRARSETAPAIDASNITTSCNDSGQPTLTLSSSVGGLSVSYTDVDGNALGTQAAGSGLLLADDGVVIANVTGSSGLVTQIVKVLECP